MNFQVTINYEAGGTEGRYIYVPDDLRVVRDLIISVRTAINAGPIYAPWNNINCWPIPIGSELTVGGIELDMIRITLDKSE